MKYITEFNIYNYRKDLLKCYKDNPLIFDTQNPVQIKDEDDALRFIGNFYYANDSMVYAIVDEKEESLYGVIIFDNMRFGENASCAQVHIAVSKEIWGDIAKAKCKEILNSCLFTNLYCEIPQCAVFAIHLAKTLGFKKTGYAPKVYSYKNKKGEEKLYDLQILSWENPRENA